MKAATITNPSHIRHHKPLKDSRELETAISGIHFVVTPQHFHFGKLKIRCTAHIHDVYWKSTEKSIEEERHKHNVNMVNNFSEDYFDLEDGNLIDRSDTYMTHIKGDVSSLNANNAAASQHCASSCKLVRLATVVLALFYAAKQLLQLWQQLFVCHKATTNTTIGRQLSGTSVATNRNTQCQTKQPHAAHCMSNEYATFVRRNTKAQQKVAVEQQQQQQQQQPLQLQMHSKTIATNGGVAIKISTKTSILTAT